MAIKIFRPRDTKNVNAGVASLEWIWSLAGRSILTYVTVSKGPKAPKDAKQSKIFAATASVSCQKAFINLKIIISLVSQKVEIYANIC